jgi:hypothetical protein
VKFDVNAVVAELVRLGFHSTSSTKSDNPGNENCAASATGQVKVFLIAHPCKEYASATFKVQKGSIATNVVVSWVVMPYRALASQYEGWANEFRSGNPPGEPPLTFNGRCYASGRNDKTVWTEQVQGTGDKVIDRQMLDAAAPMSLSSSYLDENSVD